MHTFIELAREHTCALNHTSTLIQHMCMRVWTALYKSSHFYAAPSVYSRNKESHVPGNHRFQVFFLAWNQYQYSGSIDFSFFVCAAAKVCSLHIILGRFRSYTLDIFILQPVLSIKLQLILTIYQTRKTTGHGNSGFVGYRLMTPEFGLLLCKLHIFKAVLSGTDTESLRAWQPSPLLPAFMSLINQMNKRT